MEKRDKGTMAAAADDDGVWLREHRDKYTEVIAALQHVEWAMCEPRLHEASSASVRTVEASAILARHPAGGYREAPAGAPLVTQYNLILPYAQLQRADAKRRYADVLVAQSNRAPRSHDAPNWVDYCGLTRVESHRAEDAFGGPLDPEAVFCGATPSLQIASDSDGTTYGMVLSSGVKTRYAPFDEADARRQQKTAKALRGQEEGEEKKPRRRRRGARGKKRSAAGAGVACPEDGATTTRKI
nr:hypothetical protein [Pandoravirus belohorizontensis]